MAKPTYFIDGSRFETLQGFYDEVSRELVKGESWGRNLDAFNDILRGDYSSIPRTFRLVWASSELSRERLGQPETARVLRDKLRTCHLSARDKLHREMAAAERAEGPTIFDHLLEIIRDHENVEFVLQEAPVS